MKTKPLSFFVALFLSLTLLAGKTLAQEGDLPTQPQPPTVDPGDSSSPTGMNLNFIGATQFPQTADTFIPLTETLEDEDQEPSLKNAFVVTKRDAVENTTAENIITIPQGRGFIIELGGTWIQASYNGDGSSDEGQDYTFNNPWSLKKDNENMKALVGWGNGGNSRWVISKNHSKSGGYLCNRFDVGYAFQAVDLGETTLTFTRNDVPKILTFRFNIVEAPALPTPDESSSGRK